MRSARIGLERVLGWSWMAMAAPPACRGDAAAGRGCAWSWPVTGRAGISCLLCWGGSGQFPGMSPVLDAIGVPDPARSSSAAFPGVAAARRLSRQAVICWLAGTRGDGCLRGLLRHDRRARGPPLSFRSFPGEERDGKGRDLDGGCGGRGAGGHGVRAAAFRWHGPGRGAWPASLQAAWLREPGSGVRAWPDPGVLR